MYKKIAIAGLIILVMAVMATGFWYYRQHSVSIVMDSLSSADNVVPVAIIGSGPAGLSAALYTTRLGYHTVVFEGHKPGGQLTETTYVENWPGVGKVLGAELMKRQRAYVTHLGAVLVSDTIVKVDLTRWPFVLYTDDGKNILALSVIMATGSAPRIKGIPGEQQYWGKGVTTCALCDAPFYKGKRVIIIGGGDTALEQATQIAPYAKQITIVVRKDRLRASASLYERVKALGQVSFLFNHDVVAVNGDGAWVTGVDVVDVRTKQKRVLTIDGVFLAIGHEPRSDLVAQQLVCDSAGNIKVYGRSQATSVRGVFAAGEVEDNVYRQAGVAAGDGIKAGIDAARFLTEIGWADKRQRELGVQFFAPKRVVETAVISIHSAQEFDQLIAKSDKPVVVDFYAQHCPSCMHMLPAFEAVAQQFAGDAIFVKVDTMRVPALEAQWKIERIPCFLIFKYGQLLARYYAILSKVQMIDMVRRAL